MISKDKKNIKKEKKDCYCTVMLTQTVVGLLLVALMLISVKTGSDFASVIAEGYRKSMTDDISGEDVSEAFVKIDEYADAFAQAPASSQVLSAGGKDIAFASIDALEGVCFDDVDTGFSMTEPLEDYEISSSFGYRIGPLTGEPGIHTGLDMAADYGTAVAAAADGTVEDAAWDNSYGYYVKLRHINNTVSIYAHCSELCIEEGESVSQGDVIARVGSTGDSTGNHLHFEVRKDNIRINPSYILFGA